MTQDLSRRDLLRYTAAGTLACALPGWARTVPLIPIGVQLYSVRKDLDKDFDGGLKQIADLGFQGVEFAGYGNYKNDAPGLRKKLDELGLKAAGTHIGANSFQGDALKRTIEFHHALGCKFLIVPGDGRFTKPDQSKEYAEFMSKTAEALKPEGMVVGHHNHTGEFDKAEGDKTYWDLFIERTSKDVAVQIDFGHAIYAGLDCVELVKKAAGRVKSCHVKGRLPKGTQGKKPFVGQDTADWKSILGACFDRGGTEWFLIEQEDYPDKMSPMECTKLSLEGLKRILKDMGH
jgi:sugar phosphate isomerase/epimerase